MMNMQWSIILIVLTTVQIYTAYGQCPPGDTVCGLVQCGHGTCVSNNTITACYYCRCDADYTGQACETLITPQPGCTAPCQNGGQCQQGPTNVFACKCLAEFTGNQCETRIIATHVCVTAPTTTCLNGGTCLPIGQDFSCRCVAGWTGRRCETHDTSPITTCTPNVCGAHGTCQEAITPDGNQIAICVCDQSYTGKHCETNLAAACSANYCQNGGTCQMNGNTPTCSCPNSYTGVTCETLVSTLSTLTPPVTSPSITTTTSSIPGNCASKPCLNGGSCYNTGNSFFCFCKPPYSGPTCNSQSSGTTAMPTTAPNINACASNPCNNGGTCYRYGNSFVCVCTSSYTGLICDTVKTPTTPASTTPGSGVTCANQPCRNGATCYATGNSYFCYCGTNSNYTGKNCETPKGASDASCPLNCSSGQCVQTGNLNNPYACMCNGVLTPTSC